MSAMIRVGRRHYTTNSYSYTWGFGSGACSAEVTMRVSEAVALGRSLGRPMRLSIDGRTAWFGYLHSIHGDYFSTNMQDIRNDFHADDGQRIIMSDSVDSHGLLSVVTDEDMSEDDVLDLSLPVARIGLSSRPECEVYRVKGVGVIERLNGILYTHQDAVRVDTTGSFDVGADSGIVSIRQDITLGYPTNFLSMSYKPQSATVNGSVSIIAGVTPLASANLTPNGEYVSMEFDDQPAGTTYSVYVTYSGAGAYRLPVGLYADLASLSASGVVTDESLGVTVRRKWLVSELAENLNSYVDLNFLTFRGSKFSKCFSDVVSQKLGDYLANLALVGDMTIIMSWGESNESPEIYLAGTEYRHPTNYLSERDPFLGISQRALSGQGSTDLTLFKGYSVQRYYLTVTYSYKNGRESIKIR